jgi:hypothetical protein
MDNIRDQLREMWQFLVEHNRQLSVFPPDDPNGDALKSRHRVALAVWVAAGHLSAPVAERLEIAFDQVVSHLCNSMSLCYIIYPMEAFPRGDLLARLEALEDVQTGLDTGVVDQVRVSIGRDMAFFQGLSADKCLDALWHSGEIPVDQETHTAACFLTELLSEE